MREERAYRFLTPVFGGGVRVDGQHKPSDEVTPVRVPSMRGQLRFWWRACNPHGHTTPKALLRAEEAVFGSTANPSPLGISAVKGPEAARAVPVLRDRFAVVDERHGRAYGAFPLRDTGQGTNHGVLHEHPGEWVIALSYPQAIEADVEAALWAFAHFGGLGGRVRRGFGAVEEVRRERGRLATVEEGWARFVSGAEAPWPHLPAWSARRLRSKGGWKSGADAQEYLLDVLRRLRQVDIGRRKQADDVPGRHPGRSYWPEPDTIRKLTGASAPEHKSAVTQVEAFPRAAFGLPIIFHFKDRRDPPQTTLVPIVGKEQKGRWASPLFLRPHRAESGGVEAMALVLAHPEPTGLALVVEGRKAKKGGEAPPLKAKLTRHEALHLGLGGRPSPLVTMNGTVHTDPIDRFLEEIR